ncbi:hypothetical protein [Mycolicibacterium fortuitum]|uniref:hypothetical protein n=1 Tax=Mycolicibacterium fortuitum TaxID=1766 RepID=UPI003AAEADC6
MAPRKKTGRSAAEAAYAALLKENTALVGDVGEAWDALDTALKQAVELQKNFEDARAAAVRAGAVTNDQLDLMGYKKTPKIPALPPRPGAETAKSAPKTSATPSAAEAGRGEQSNGATPAPQLASVGAPGGEDH